MPTYEYACKSCGQHLEIVQSFKDEPLTTCPACSGELRKVFGSIGIAFKGSGFYRTDNRGGGSSSRSTADAASGGKNGAKDGSSEKKSETKSEAKSDTKSDNKSGTKSGTKSEAKSA